MFFNNKWFVVLMMPILLVVSPVFSVTQQSLNSEVDWETERKIFVFQSPYLIMTASPSDLDGFKVKFRDFPGKALKYLSKRAPKNRAYVLVERWKQDGGEVFLVSTFVRQGSFWRGRFCETETRNAISPDKPFQAGSFTMNDLGGLEPLGPWHVGDNSQIWRIMAEIDIRATQSNVSVDEFNALVLPYLSYLRGAIKNKN